MNRLDFFKESIKNLRTVGTLTRSSRFLSQKMADQINYKEAKFIVELGAGDGVITRFILKNMAPDAKLMSFEVNPEFCTGLRAIDDDRLIVIEDSADKIAYYLKEHNFSELDGVVSAIPFVVVPEKESYHIIESCREQMKLDSPFIQVHYSLLTRKMYKKIFGNLDIKFVFLNLPPAFVLVSRKDAEHLITG